MFMEEKIDLLLSEQQRLISLMELFVPDLKTEKGVIHFLQITKNTFNKYIKDEILEEGIHYITHCTKRIFIPDAVIKLKKSGVKGRHRQSSEDEAILESVNAKFGIITKCRHVVQKDLS